MSAPSGFEVHAGGRCALSAGQAAALRRIGRLIRTLSDAEAAAAVGLLEELATGNGLEDLREIDMGVLRVLAEVLKGWEVDGVHEFGRAWVSTLISRRDGFAWDRSTVDERAEHRRNVEAEMARRRL
jgi:hypothetical protein